MDAGEVFDLECLGKVTTRDKRQWVVYDDGRYRHVVSRQHWDEPNFRGHDDAETMAAEFSRWNSQHSQWADELTAREAAWRADVDYIHSADGLCTTLDCTDWALCRAIAEAHRGKRWTDAAFLADADRVYWDSVWPEVDEDGDLTGHITEGDGCRKTPDDMAMIPVSEAKAGGWIITDEYATPPQ